MCMYVSVCGGVGGASMESLARRPTVEEIAFQVHAARSAKIQSTQGRRYFTLYTTLKDLLLQRASGSSVKL